MLASATPSLFGCRPPWTKRQCARDLISGKSLAQPSFVMRLVADAAPVDRLADPGSTWERELAAGRLAAQGQRPGRAHLQGRLDLTERLAQSGRLEPVEPSPESWVTSRAALRIPCVWPEGP